MEEEIEIIYTYILIKTDGTYLGWSKANGAKISEESSETAPSGIKAGDGMQWIEWNKPLPEDIDTSTYNLVGGTLVEEV